MSLIYRFRMLSDENDNFVRDFEVPSNYTLLQLNDFILKMLNYEPCMTSFFTSNKEWECLKEYTLMDMGEGPDTDGFDQPEAMEKVHLDEVLHYMNDRLIYLFDPINERAFYMEVVEASEPQADMTYPRVQFEHSPAPNQYDPEANEQSGSIFDEMMGDYNDFDGDDAYDDENKTTYISMAYDKTLISIVGPTGSGKTDLSIAVARHYSAPIISTDSRQFYRGIPIGTAQPDNEQLTLVEHHFIASHEITDDFNCGAYEVAALQRVEQLFHKHDVIVAVGGSGLYIKALCEGMDAMPEADNNLRTSLSVRLQQSGLEPLVEQLKELDPKTYETIDRKNPARVLRALEICLSSGRPCSELRTGERHKRNFNIVKIGVDMDREILYDRINRRVDIMIQQGLEAEARSVEHLRKCNSLQTVGYREMFDYFDGKTTLDEAIELIKRNSRRYAKRQMTWFRRDDEIAWFEPSKLNEIVDYIDSKICTLK